MVKPMPLRRVLSFVSILFVAAFAPANAGAQPAAIAIGGTVEHAGSVTLDQLRALPATTETVFFSTGHGPVNASFTGALLWTVLTRAGVKLDPKLHNGILRKYVLVTGSDGYQALFSLGELDPEFGGAQVIVAYEQDGKPLGADSGGLRLVVPGDKAGGRNVSKIATIVLRDGS
jgi:DMSO/TMAO reductase YedYZ molybdopterin-dependent catalytic subunit